MAEVLTIDDFEQELESLIYPTLKWGKLTELAESLDEESQVEALRETLELGEGESEAIDDFFGELVYLVKDHGNLLVPITDGDYASVEMPGRLRNVVLPPFTPAVQTVVFLGSEYAVVTVR